MQDRTDEAEQTYNESLRLCTWSPEDLQGQIRALTGLGILHKRTGTAETYFRQARDVSRKLGDEPRSTAWLERELGDALRLQGRFPEAEQNIRASVHTFRNLHMEFEQAHSLRTLAMLLVFTGRFRDAENCFSKSMELFDRCTQGQPRMYESFWIRLGLGDVALGRRDFKQARDLYSEALKLCEGSEFETAVVLGSLADLSCVEQQWEPCMDYADQSLDLRRGHGDKFGIGWELSTKGTAFVRQQRLSDALDCFRGGLQLMREYHSPFVESKLTLGLCEVYCLQRDIRSFRNAAGRVRSWAEKFGYPDQMARLHVLRGLFALQRLDGRAPTPRLLTAIGKKFGVALRNALRHSVFFLDETARDIRETLERCEALQASGKAEILQALMRDWVSGTDTINSERLEREAEYGHRKTATISEQFAPFRGKEHFRRRDHRWSASKTNAHDEGEE